MAKVTTSKPAADPSAAEKPAAEKPAKAKAAARTAKAATDVATPRAAKAPRPEKTPRAGGRAAGGARAKAAAAPLVEDAAEEGASNSKAPVLRTRDLVDQVAEQSGMKKTDAKRVIEAALAVLGDALARGEGFALSGLGKGKVARSKSEDGSAQMVVKIRRQIDAGE